MDSKPIQPMGGLPKGAPLEKLVPSPKVKPLQAGKGFKYAVQEERWVDDPNAKPMPQ